MGSCQTWDETSLTQSFTGVDTNCLVDFTNDIAGSPTLDTLVVNVTSPFTGAISCALGDDAPLNTAVVSSPTSCTFEDLTEIYSIDPGSTYSLLFDPGFGSTVDITLSQTVITTPEPATILMLLIGLAALLLSKKASAPQG